MVEIALVSGEADPVKLTAVLALVLFPEISSYTSFLKIKQLLQIIRSQEQFWKKVIFNKYKRG